MIRHKGRIIRFAQDAYPHYGSSVRAFCIEELSLTSYREQEIDGGPVLAASGAGWNTAGMHQIDAHPLEGGRWLACVDGNRPRRTLNWRYGVRRALHTLCDR
jgi:hypothetical protein